MSVLKITNLFKMA